MGKKKPKIFPSVPIERMDAKGKGIGKAPDGRVIFVPFTAPGDVADILVTKKRKSYYEGKALKFHTLSDWRVPPRCDYFGICGGCQLQHIAYDKQLEVKASTVRDHFARIGNVEPREFLPPLEAPRIYEYRNKMEYAFTDSRWLTPEEIASGQTFDRRGAGFHKPGQWDKIIDIEYCHLQPEPGNDIRNALRDFAKEREIPFYNPRSREGLLRQLTVRVMKSGEIMVMVHFAAEDPERIREVMDFLKEKFPRITSLHYLINPKPNDSIYDLEVRLWSGQPHVIEEIDGLKFRIKPKSFFQTNSYQTDRLYRRVREAAEIGPEDTVYDLFAGTGTIGIFLARHARKVVGLETVPEAVEDARENARLNRIDNIVFEIGDVKDLFGPELFARHGMPDVVITDPPREGMHPRTVEMLKEVKPRRIVYVSCNSATQARDIAALRNFYELRSVQPVDMFPQTYHTESIAVLDLKT
ncbi:MAG: 23S rRNA (uracil(1939)-C(5))-methyltransferase RlmD [Chlorobi bacterium]|nr:23S rRNA (uracil(1939)-C(5))-methyltransferase RlmD [Chlorobiota bacterium]